MPDPSLEYSTAVINQTKRKSKARERAETGAEGGVEDEVDRDHRPRSGYQLRRPKQGELLWHNTGIEIDGDGGRSRMYGWTEVGGESKSMRADAEELVQLGAAGLSWTKRRLQEPPIGLHQLSMI